jgi:hypothetical protein
MNEPIQPTPGDTVEPSAWRSPARPHKASDLGPVWFLLGGVAFGLGGYFVLSYGLLLAFSQMDRAGGPPGIFLVVQEVGFVSIVIGAALVALSLAWWIWRIVRLIWRIAAR